ncbi:MAG: hypothetical protein O7J95_09260, partial [Planctomycetota bacterium]|nr:hypothetical protein [Planctomycetota bacterium]
MRHARLILFTAILSLQGVPAVGAEPTAIGARLELFVDRALVERLDGVELRTQRPEPREVVLVTDRPWEGNTCAYYTIFQDRDDTGDRYRMYYRGSHHDEKSRKAAHREVTCYAESRDGVHWTKPELGLFEFGGSKRNNIVWDGIGTHCFAPFKDVNPACDADARYKAIARGRPRGKKGLYVFKSPDGIRWSLLRDEPVITNGDFDSQNLAFWDTERELYVDYHRRSRDGRRDIMTCTSRDFVSWSEPVFLEYPGAPREHLYTNAIRQYDRAPHIRLGFPTRYNPSTQQVEPILMASRDGRTFHRWPEALIPITAPKDRDGNRSNYLTRGLVRLPGREKEYSVYATEAYYTGPDSRVRRFTFRVDGFVSASASKKGGGELVTRPLTFTGRELILNHVVRTGGRVRVELQDAGRRPYDGFSLADCTPL